VCRCCGGDGHNSPECNTAQDKVEIHRQSNQANQGVSQLVHTVDWDGVNDTIDDDEATSWVFLNKSQMLKKPTVSFQSDGPTKCTEHNKTGAITQAHKSTVFSQANSGMPSTWHLLDNQSACDIVSNPKLARNIRQVEGHMQLATQAGSTTANWMADVPGYYRPVWFHAGGIANILSMVNMIEKCRVTYDSRGGQHPNAFCVHKKDGTIRKFQQSRRGLCCLDTAAQNNHTVLATAAAEANKSKHTDRDCSRAQLARKIQNLVGRPELKDFLRYLDSNSLPNCPMQRQDAVNADAMFGRDVASLKGKVTRQQLQTVLGAVANNLPKEIMEHCRDIASCVDIMFVNRIPFFMIISKKVRFMTAEALIAF
jgi:hypothetical protein